MRLKINPPTPSPLFMKCERQYAPVNYEYDFTIGRILINEEGLRDKRREFL